MASKRFKLDEGKELRGYMIALFPTEDQAIVLRAMQLELMLAWNVLVTSRETHIDHCVRWAEDSGLELPEEPERPEPDAPDEVWGDYRKQCGERRHAAIRLGLAEPGLGWDAWRIDYKRLRELFGGKGKQGSVAPAQAYTALVERFRRTKGPVHKRRPLEMPLQIKSGKLFSREAEPSRHDGVGAVTNGELTFAGMRIRARWWREPAGEFLEGASIRLENFRWVASLKVKAPPRIVPRASAEVVGVNVGLKWLVALSDGQRWLNPRGNEYTHRVASLSEAIARETDGNRQRDLRWQLTRYQTHMARRTRAIVSMEVLPALARYDTIVLGEGESGLKRAAQGQQCRLSVRGLGGYTSFMSETHALIRQRYPERVREEEPGWISQQCSHCGHYDEMRFRRGHLRDGEGDYCRCPNPKCREYGIKQHVDVNAARNLVAKWTKSRQAAE